MATREELRQRIINRFIARTDITAAQMLEALTSLTPDHRERFIAEINSGRADRAGRSLLEIRKRYMTMLADAEADRILADDAIDFDEIDKVL